MSTAVDPGLRIGPRTDPDRYRLGSAVGSGAEGILYRGSITTTTGMELDVAIKMLQPGLLPFVDEWHARWSEQVELLRSLQIPGVVQVRDGFLGPLPHAPGHAGDVETLYLVMNWVAGETLDEWIRRRPDCDRLDVLKRLVPVGAALDLMHSGRATRGIPVVHRDIKPSNILVDEEDAVLVDFGLTRGAPKGRRTSGVAGTPGYLAPEALADGVYTPATDRYALGAVAYFVLTGSEPPTSYQPEQMRAALASLEPLSDRPETVGHLMKMLDADPDARPAMLANWLAQLRRSSLAELAEPLRPRAARRNPGADDGGAFEAGPGQPTAPPRAPSERRPRTRLRSVALAVLAAAALTSLVLRTTTDRSPALPPLYQDNFDGGQNWYEHDDATALLAYDKGQYRMEARTPNQSLLSDTTFRGGVYGEPLTSLTDVSVRAVASPVSPVAVFGVFCRNEPAGYYAGLVRTDGHALIVKSTPAGMRALGDAQGVPLPQGPTPIRLDCAGKGKARLTFFVGGTEVIEVTDDQAISAGGVGLLLGSEATPASVLFDDFVLYGRRA